MVSSSASSTFFIKRNFSKTNCFFPVVYYFSTPPPPVLDPTSTALNSSSKGVSIEISVGDGEPIESALRRFKRACQNSGHLQELRHKRYFENSQERKKRKIKEKGLRNKFEKMNRKRMAKRT